jgi:hypothetical protein
MMRLTNVPWMCRSLAPLVAVLAVAPLSGGNLPNDMSVPDGFDISLYADDETAGRTTYTRDFPTRHTTFVM